MITIYRVKIMHIIMFNICRISLSYIVRLLEIYFMEFYRETGNINLLSTGNFGLIAS